VLVRTLFPYTGSCFQRCVGIEERKEVEEAAKEGGTRWSSLMGGCEGARRGCEERRAASKAAAPLPNLKGKKKGKMVWDNKRGWVQKE